MKYFRTYPWALQLLLFVLLVFTLYWLGIACTNLVLQQTRGISLVDALKVTGKSSPQQIHTALAIQGVFSTAMFLVPSLLFANLTHPRPLEYIGLRSPRKALHPFLAILAVLGAMPVLTMLGSLMSHIDFGETLKAQQKASEDLQEAFLVMPGFVDFLRTFTVMAIIPGIGEELFFRGVMMRFARQRARSMAMPIIFSSVLFALVHSNYYGMPSILLAGALLAGIYYLTGSLVNGMLAHIAFNGMQIILAYMNVLKPNDNTINWALVAGGATLFAGAFYLLWKTRSPLTDNWYKDFDESRGEVPPAKQRIFG